MRTTLIALQCGYAEDGYVSWLFFGSQGHVFDTGIDALQNLAEGFLGIYEEDGGIRKKLRMRACCKEFMERKQEGDRYCPNCRTDLGPGFNLEDFQSWLRERHCQTADTWGGEFEGNCEWWPWPSLQEILAVPREEILYIAEHGENVLCQALRGDELDFEEYRNALKEFWEEIAASVQDWDRKHGWDGTRECFARQLDEVKNDTYPFRLGTEGE